MVLSNIPDDKDYRSLEMMKKVLFMGLFLGIGFWTTSTKLCAQTKAEQALLWRAYEIRSAQNPEANKKKFIENLQKEKISLQVNLAIENILVLDEIPFLYKNKQNKKVYLLVSQQEKKCNELMKANSSQSINKWIYVSCADILTQSFAFTSPQELAKKSMLVKTYYVTALKLDKKFSPAYISYGVWLYHAPAIAGGGLDQALKRFNQALKFAKRKTESYLAYIYRSQVYFATNHPKEWNEDLESAHKIFPYPNETFTKYVREKNEKQGLSLFSR